MLKNQQGFTFTELIIAMAVFSFLLIMVTAGFISVARTQQRATADRKTQQNARKSLEFIVRDAREAQAIDKFDDCLAAGKDNFYLHSPGGITKYYVATDVSAGVDRLYRGTVTRDISQVSNPLDCNTPVSGSEVLTGADVHVSRVDVDVSTAVLDFPNANISVTVAAKGSSLNAAGDRCLATGGSQTCSVTTLNTNVSVKGVR